MTPPATLSDAMWAATTPPFAPRSTVMTGIFAALTFLMIGTMALLSVGLIAMTATFFWMRSSIWLASRAASFCASKTASVSLAFAAWAWAPSRKSTKKGLFSVEIESPTVGGAAAYNGRAARTSNTTPASTPLLRIRFSSSEMSFDLPIAIQCAKRSIRGTIQSEPDGAVHRSLRLPGRSSCAEGRPARLTQAAIQEHGQQDDRPLDHLLVERAHSE